MAVLTCLLPSFPLALLARSEPAVLDRPVAVLTPHERVLDVSAKARQAGILIGQTARQARISCPDLEVRSVDLQQCDAEFDALLSLLDDYTEAVEPHGIGRAYLDLPELSQKEAMAVCRDMGQRIRRDFGPTFAPAIGCNHSKFTALAAAQATRPGAMRVVQRAQQPTFLAPLSVRLLPFSDEDQRRLGLLGIRCLGEYAALTSRSVLQQFGKPGQTAHQWARGLDNRPVISRRKRPTITVTKAFDSPIDTVPALLITAIRLLRLSLDQLQAAFQGVQRIQVICTLTTAHTETDTWTLRIPTAEASRLHRLLAGRWQERVWRGPVNGITIRLSEVQDVWVEQAALFATTEVAENDNALLDYLQLRYGQERLRAASVNNPRDLRLERRVTWRDVSSHAVA